MKEIINKSWEYILYQKDTEYILSVVCGTIGLYEINIKLNGDEKKNYEKDGVESIDTLFKKICDEPLFFRERHIEDIFR